MDPCSQCEGVDEGLECGCLLLLLFPPIGVLYFVVWALDRALSD